MSDDDELTEHKRKLRIQIEKRNEAYRNLFRTKNISKTRLDTARKRVLKDLDDIIGAKTHFPDEKGHYCEIRAALEEGNRKCAIEMKQFIYSTPTTGTEKKEPNVKRA